MSIAIDQSKCIACGDCVSVCPVEIIELADGGKAQVTDTDECIECAACVAACDSDAISL